MENLSKLLKVINTDKLITEDEIVQVLTGITNLLTQFKKNTEDLNLETKQEVNDLYSKVSDLLDTHNVKLQNTIKEERDLTKKDIEKRKKEVVALKKEIEILINEAIANLPEDGDDGDTPVKGVDYFTEKEIEDIKKDISDNISGESVRDALETLNGEERLDAKYIKNLKETVTIWGSPAGASGGGTGTGDVVGPASSTDNAIVRFDGTTGKLIQNSIAALTDTGELSGLTQLDVDNIRIDGNTISSTNTNGNINLAPNGTGDVVMASLQASTSGGFSIHNNSGADIALFGAGGGQNATFYGGVKLNAQTASRILSTDASSNILALDTATYPSLAELTYVKGVTSSIQTQINAKGAGTVTSVTSANGALSVATGTTTPVLTVNSAPILTTARTIGTLTGDATSSGSTFDGSANNTNAITLATVNSNVGSFTNASITVNAKGLITAASSGTAPVTSVGATSPITSSGGATPTISTSMATNRLIGRSTAGTGVMEEIIVGSGLSLSAGTLTASGGGTTTQSIAQTAHGLSAGNYIKSNGTDNQFAKAQSDNGANAEIVGYVTSVTDANNFVYQPLGFVVTNNVPSQTAGTAMFLDPTTAGALTATEPSTGGQVSKPAAIIIANGSKMVVFNMRGMLIGSGTTGLTIGSTSISGGTTTKVLYNNAGSLGEYTISGSGNVAMTTSPTFTTPTLGIASATTVNKVTLTAPATGSTLTIADGKTLTASNTLTFTGTDSSSVAFGTGGTVVYTTSSPTLGTITTTGNIELGNASDTTLSRVSAGVIAVEGVTVPTISSTSTLTNKRMQPRTASSTTASTLTPDLSSANVYFRTTQTATLTIEAPIGTPVIGETIMIYVDSAGAQTLTINGTYKAFGAAFPATTTAGKTFMMSAQYNGTDWKTLWAVAQ